MLVLVVLAVVLAGSTVRATLTDESRSLERDVNLPAVADVGVPERPPTRPSDQDRPARHRQGRALAAASSTVIPETGPGTFDVAPGSTSLVGSGDLFTYTVEVEEGVPVELGDVTRIVDRTLSDPRGWISAGAHALQRLATDTDVRVLIATPGTTDALCAPLVTGGRLSCRNGNLVILNAWRWSNGADTYRSLDRYRRYLINHEFGHALGNGHEVCGAAGSRASVMLQQTKGLQGCKSNPWPSP